MQPSPAVGVNRLTARRGLRALRRKTVPFAIHRASLPHRPLIRHGPLGCATFSPRRRRGVICHRLPFACPLAVIAPGLAGHAGPALRGNDTACHSSTPGGNRSRAGGAEPRPYIRSSFLPHFISPRRSLSPGCGRFVKRPYDIHALFSVGRDLCVPPCPVAVSHASYPQSGRRGWLTPVLPQHRTCRLRHTAFRLVLTLMRSLNIA